MISDFWLGVIITVCFEAIAGILLVDYLVNSRKDDEDEKNNR